MSDPRHPRQPHPRSRVALALAATFGLLLALVQGVAGPASADAPPPTPTSLTVTASNVQSVIDRLDGAPDEAIPSVLAGPDDPFLVTVRLWAGAVEAAYPSDQQVAFQASGPGGLSLLSGTIAAGQSTAEFTMSYSEAAMGVAVTAAVGKGRKAIAGTSNAFEVTRTLTFLPQTTSSIQGGADGVGCTTVDRDTPLCGIVTLPNGAASDVALTLGDCASTDACKDRSLVTQMIADLTGIYDRSNPARMDLVCDKTLCNKAGVQSFTALWSQSATGNLVPVPACAAKGVIDAELEPPYCTDYRSSTRDNAGDLHLIVLFLTDVRGSI